VAAKYRDFGRQDQASPRARMFVAMEDWLNDGIPLVAPVARETLGFWYGANTPAAGSWRVLGLPIRPENLRLPCFVAAPGRDRIVPPESARALAAAIPGAELHLPPAGHIGMVAGSTAKTALWERLAGWLRAGA
jgi:poly(3-hydroxyalkanoate) synthetase